MRGKIVRQQITRQLKDIILLDGFAPAERATGSRKYRIPQHQRFGSWPTSYKVALVDSIFCDYPIGAIILTTHVDATGIYYNIQDGQTRLSALQDFTLGRFAWDGRRYTELTDEEKCRFSSYIVRLDNVEPAPGTSSAEFELCVSDMFERLNTAKPLSDNDKFHNKQGTPAMQLMHRLLVSPDFAADIHRYMWASVGEGKKRTHLKSFVCVVLASALLEPACLTTSYSQNAPTLVAAAIGPEEERRAREFLRSYFAILRAALPGDAKPEYGKVSGVCGLALCNWIVDQKTRCGFEPGVWGDYVRLVATRKDFERGLFSDMTRAMQNGLGQRAIQMRMQRVLEMAALGTLGAPR
jgi:hypothetical protein